VPLKWAATTGNEGFAFALIANRINNAAMAETAVQQMQTAIETLRSGGQDRWATKLQAQLNKAESIRDRLKSK
jgi:hypothetical protein